GGEAARGLHLRPLLRTAGVGRRVPGALPALPGRGREVPAADAGGAVPRRRHDDRHSGDPARPRARGAGARDVPSEGSGDNVRAQVEAEEEVTLVTMVNSVGEHPAGEDVELPDEQADMF